MALFDKDIAELRDAVAALREKQVEHEVRFSNGREIMAEIKTDLAVLKPTAPNWIKLLGVVATIFGMTLGGYYWLLEELNHRPTATQIEQAFREHRDEVRQDIGQIRDRQTEQRTILNTLESTVTAQGKKLDMILTRLPRRARDP